jgi:hypothetical protein
MIQPQGDPWLLRWDLAKTNLLDRDLPPAFLYYNPWPEEKRITVETAAGTRRVHDLTRNRTLELDKGSTELRLGAHEARVIEIRS